MLGRTFGSEARRSRSSQVQHTLTNTEETHEYRRSTLTQKNSNNVQFRETAHTILKKLTVTEEAHEYRKIPRTQKKRTIKKEAHEYRRTSRIQKVLTKTKETHEYKESSRYTANAFGPQLGQARFDPASQLPLKRRWPYLRLRIHTLNLPSRYKK